MISNLRRKKKYREFLKKLGETPKKWYLCSDGRIRTIGTNEQIRCPLTEPLTKVEKHNFNNGELCVIICSADRYVGGYSILIRRNLLRKTDLFEEAMRRDLL